MRLSSIRARRYRSVYEETVELADLNIFIGANASGKSTLLDALRFLHEGVQARDFRRPVFARGGIVHLAWKGEHADVVEMVASVEGDNKTYEWSVRLVRDGFDFSVEEKMDEVRSGMPPTTLLDSRKGEGWWWSGDDNQRIELKQPDTACALAAASADASFPGRRVAEFIGRWGFFDPSPFLLRRDWAGLDAGRFDPYGRNLGETMYSVQKSSPKLFNSIIQATQAVVGLPVNIEPRETEDRFYFVQTEAGLQYPVHQMGVSSGTLRVLALMTALHAQPEANLIGIEEPENYVHPRALEAFVEYLFDARDRMQLMITTHSPPLLDFVSDPAAIRVVRRGTNGNTTVMAENNAQGVMKALEESGFGLGEFHETKGFGA